MVMTLVVMNVRAKTVTECQETVCKSLCDQKIKNLACTSCVYGCASPPSFQHSDTSNQNSQSILSITNFSTFITIAHEFENY